MCHQGSPREAEPVGSICFVVGNWPNPGMGGIWLSSLCRAVVLIAEAVACSPQDSCQERKASSRPEPISGRPD